MGWFQDGPVHVSDGLGRHAGVRVFGVIVLGQEEPLQFRVAGDGGDGAAAPQRAEGRGQALPAAPQDAFKRAPERNRLPRLRLAEPPEAALRELEVEAPTAKTDIRRRSFFAPHLGQGLPLPFSPMKSVVSPPEVMLIQHSAPLGAAFFFSAQQTYGFSPPLQSSFAFSTASLPARHLVVS